MLDLSSYRAELIREYRRELGYAKARLAAARGRYKLLPISIVRKQLVRAWADVYIWQARVDSLS